jgi:glutathione S-transferase
VEVLPEYYGYVVFVAVDSIFVNAWMAYKVGQARKKYNVPYPLMYSPDSNDFNCVQRAHQHTLELFPQYITLLLLGGLQHPRLAAGAGVVYLLGRVLFAKGYYTGDPEQRKKGAFGGLGLIALLGSTLCFGAHLLGWKHPAFLKFHD